MGENKVQKPVSWELSVMNRIIKHMEDCHINSFSEAVNKLVKKGLGDEDE